MRTFHVDTRQFLLNYKLQNPTIYFHDFVLEFSWHMGQLFLDCLPDLYWVLSLSLEFLKFSFLLIVIHVSRILKCND